MNNPAIKYLQEEFQYLEKLIIYRLNNYFFTEQDNIEPAIPDLDKWQLPIADFIRKNNLTHSEAIVLLVALAPHIIPEIGRAHV